MSAVLNEFFPETLTGGARNLHEVLEPTAFGVSDGGITSNLPMLSRSRWKTVEPVVRRRVSDVPELDVSVYRKNNASIGTVHPDVNSHRVASQLLAEWHGQVLTIGAESFTAQLKGRHGAGVLGLDEEAVIPLEDVRDADRELLAVGAFFSLCISYEIDASGSKRRYAEVIFRRMPAYRREELEVARERARTIVRGLRLE
jgi:hypothetical protein